MFSLILERIIKRGWSLFWPLDFSVKICLEWLEPPHAHKGTKASMLRMADLKDAENLGLQ